MNDNFVIRKFVRICTMVLVTIAVWLVQGPMFVNAKEQDNFSSGSDFFAKSARPYRGITLRGISEYTPASEYVRDVLAPAFEHETGIKVILELMSLDLVYAKSTKDMTENTGTYDYVYVEQGLIYNHLKNGFLVDLTQMMEQYPDMVSSDFRPGNFISFINYFKKPGTENLHAILFEAFPKVYLYRKDLFSHADIRKAFSKKYGYELSPAITISQYSDIAEFFTWYGSENKLELWGSTVQAAQKDNADFYELVETILPTFGVYYWGVNLKNYKATVENGGRLNSKRAKQALAFWVNMMKYAPPEAINSTWTEVADTFAAGRVAQGWVYGENVSRIVSDSKKSKVVGKVGIALPPTIPGVVEEASIGDGYVGFFDGGAFGMSRASRQKKATLLWLQYLGISAIQPQWAVKAGRIVHMATFHHPEVRKQDKILAGYFLHMEKYNNLYAGAPPFPFHNELLNIAEPFIHKAMTGKLTPSEALDKAAKSIDKELIRLGYGK